jgi:ketosteroid isomerase-like protein
MVSVLLMMALQATPAVPAVSAIACPVWERELSFADSVRRHDAAAFAEHVDPDAVFSVNGKSPLHGRAVIGEHWAGLVSGKAGRLDWYPDHVVAANSGDIAWSSGPALFEMVDGKGGTTAMLSRFNSVWRKNADGEWRVVFDSGSDPVKAGAEEVKAFQAHRARSCDMD